VILARVAALPVRAQSFLVAASVLGQRAPMSAIVSVSRLPDAQDEVDAAVAAGLLTEGASALELAFTHPLYRAAIYADLSPAHRRELQARAAEVAVGRAAGVHRAAASLGPDEALAGELEASARTTSAAGDAAASAKPRRAGGGPAGRYRADQPGGGRPAVCVSEDGGVPPPQQLQARHHLPPSASRAPALAAPQTQNTKHRVEPRVTPWGQCRAARVSYELWTPHQHRGKRFAFSSISTGLRTDGSRDEYALTAPTPGSHSQACTCAASDRAEVRPQRHGSPTSGPRRTLFQNPRASRIR